MQTTIVRADEQALRRLWLFAPATSPGSYGRGAVNPRAVCIGPQLLALIPHRLLPAQFAALCVQRIHVAVARADRDGLLMNNRRGRDRVAGLKFPAQISCFCVKCIEMLIP